MHAVAPDGWHAPTPCTEWDVHALVSHVVHAHRWVPAMVEGRTIEEVGDAFDGDQLGSDAYGAWDAARKGSLEAVNAADLGGVVHASFGDIPVEEYVLQVAFDTTIHAWDLARGTGSNDRLDPELVAAAHDYITPRAQYWGFEAVEVPAGAEPQDELIGLTGRQP